MADSGEVSQDGIFTLKQLKADGGCTVRTENRTADPAWQGPADVGTNAVYLAVPKDLRPLLGNLLKPAATPSQTLAELQKFFNSFSYTLEGVNTGRKQDPVLHFLKVSRAGHCEFFATANSSPLRRSCCCGMPGSRPDMSPDSCVRKKVPREIIMWSAPCMPMPGVKLI